jgi:hypothetical protein
MAWLDTRGVKPRRQNAHTRVPSRCGHSRQVEEVVDVGCMDTRGRRCRRRGAAPRRRCGDAVLLAAGDIGRCTAVARHGPYLTADLLATRPVPGNHEHRNTGAVGYFDYWRGQARPTGHSYYSFDLGE